MSRSTSLPTSTRRAASLLSAPLPRRAALAALLLPLAACTGGAPDSTADGDDTDSAADGDAGPETALTVSDPWVKAGEEGMTSAFGTLTNDTDRDLLLIGARTEASAHVELHETTDDGSGGMSMQEKEGGFPLAAGEQLVLEPGGHHLMLMDLTAPLLPGDEVELILEFEDGTEHPLTATVKDFAGAQEHYAPEDSAGSDASDGGGAHDGHDDHDDHDDHDGHDGHDADGGDR
ncbi:uncharacterized conserved protein [Brachybacterium faecium DSM 4810]|uniref:Uncharacterized conserved protein n=1 Tax=Brachybacterium faecium (strain ATCC 43885 / DSM 4810 / JCM 11609 / LMG 19847 / NBRC 14762 / NCIMB 9860 / 6-10) TaxID=446465 RepID=C7MAX3_BRAFD|nr:copper chaperone PCu(A)C [Brachybacterium faecium]ACU86860.1 uncharacterized conserved protein [Brachybacterium faecium DSM 4810]